LLTSQEKTILQELIAKNDSLSRLAALKQDAKDFKTKMMSAEIRKLNTLKPIYQ
jgi:hypothetical protein